MPNSTWMSFVLLVAIVIPGLLEYVVTYFNEVYTGTMDFFSWRNKIWFFLLVARSIWFAFLFQTKYFTFSATVNIDILENTAWKVSVFGVFLARIFPHSDQNNSEYGHFLRSRKLCKWYMLSIYRQHFVKKKILNKRSIFKYFFYGEWIFMRRRL